MTMIEPAAPPEPGRRADRHERLAALLLEAQAGRRESLERIVVELSPLLWQVARSQGLDREGAEDAVQCTWLSLLGSLERIHTPVALTAWLVTATKREAWRVRAASRAELPVDGSTMTEMTDIPDPVPAPEESVLLAERHRDVWRAVRRLPQRCQELLRVVAFVHRPDYDEVAVALGMPRGSIGPTRGRCLAKLRTLLDTEPRGSAS
ncbi:MAG TPA: sigma-70 family RNA polymerase sigma factor [Actinocrinis sp.]|nr:sigma-70 family RNA polymerase sigma factor [Actinocrinis sp.]